MIKMGDECNAMSTQNELSDPKISTVDQFHYWEVGNGNRYSAEKFTKEEAEEHAATLIDCTDCLDCTHCKNCTGCYASNWCEDCINCNELNGCVGCEGCHNCIKCTDCKECKKCNGCVNCDKCWGCVQCRDWNWLEKKDCTE